MFPTLTSRIRIDLIQLYWVTVWSVNIGLSNFDNLYLQYNSEYCCQSMSVFFFTNNIQILLDWLRKVQWILYQYGSVYRLINVYPIYFAQVLNLHNLAFIVQWNIYLVLNLWWFLQSYNFHLYSQVKRSTFLWSSLNDRFISNIFISTHRSIRTVELQ